MLELPNRTFEIAPAVRKQVPLWVGLFGPSGGGKTYSALRLAKGIASVQGGPIYGVDTEAGRMLHYADQFQFNHIPFSEPFGSLDYLAVVKAALAHNTSGKRPTVIIDSLSHEHEGPGGMLELHDQTATKMATWDGKFDAKKYERVKMIAWGDPKAKRRALINGLLRLEANFILCFRAKESSVPVQKVVSGQNGGRDYTKTEVVNQGFVPIGGDDFVYECTLAALLMPGARGVPSWSSDMVGEKRMIKLPEQFKQLPDLGAVQLDEKVGAQLATWADNVTTARSGGGAPTANQATDGADAPAKPKPTRAERAREWTDWFKGEVKGCRSAAAIEGLREEHEATLSTMQKDMPDLYREADTAAEDQLASL